MNISEALSILKSKESNDRIFAEGVAFNIKAADDATSSVFYGNTRRNGSIYRFSADETDAFRQFAIRYTCYMLSQYPLRGMSGAVKNCGLDELQKWGDLKSDTLKKLALDSYFLLGLQQYVSSPEFKQDMNNRVMFNTHKGDYVWELKALLFLLGEAQPSVAQETLAHWKAWDSSQNWDSYLNYDWNQTLKDKIDKTGWIYQQLYPKVETACGKERKETHVVRGGSYASGYPVTSEERREYTYYGEAVGQWLKRTADQYGYFKREPAYLGTAPPDSGCVKKGTKILLASGKTAPIETLRAGDMVINEKKLPSYCSDEMVYNPHVKKLYSINDDEPFLSFDHPIYTQQGWCSLAPEISMQTNPNFTVHKLKEGYSFEKMVMKKGKATFKKVTIERINVKEYDLPQECYDLEFYDGYNSYYANGYPCLCNYPHITSSYLEKSIQKMEREQQLEVIGLLQTNKNLLCRLIGEHCMNMIEQRLEEIGGTHDEME